MIYELMQSLQTRFTAAGFPTAFEYGPRRTTLEGFRDHLIVVERDTENPDQLSPANGQQTNPRRYMVRNLSARATIYAQSPLPGALADEHEAECEQLVDAFLVSFHDWGSEARARLGDIVPVISECRYLKRGEYPEGAEAWNGVVYVIRFRIGRGVCKRNYEMQARPTGSAAGVGSRIEIQNASDPPIVVTL